MTYLFNTLDELKKSDLNGTLIVGKVVDNNDPQKLGRVKVFIESVYSKINDKDLPWATVMQPVSYGSIDGYSSFAVPVVGSLVVVTFHEGSIYSPVVVGRLVGSSSAPPSELSQDYPNTSGVQHPDGTIVRQSGSITEILHSSGTTLTIDADGNIDVMSVADTTIGITGDLTINAANVSIAAESLVFDVTNQVGIDADSITMVTVNGVDITGDVDLTGAMQTSGDVTIGGISFLGHKHTVGPATSSTPF